jgi:hypothetical protein
VKNNWFFSEEFLSSKYVSEKKRATFRRVLIIDPESLIKEMVKIINSIDNEKKVQLIDKLNALVNSEKDKGDLKVAIVNASFQKDVSKKILTFLQEKLKQKK